MNAPTFHLKPLGPAIRTKTTPKHLSSPSNYNSTNNLLTATPLSPSAKPYSSPKAHPTPVPTSNPTAKPTKHTTAVFVCPHLLPHPAAPDPSGIATACPNKSATGLMCAKPVDAHQHHCYGSGYGGLVGRRHAAVAPCLADVIQTRNTTVSIEQTIPATPVW